MLAQITLGSDTLPWDTEDLKEYLEQYGRVDLHTEEYGWLVSHSTKKESSYGGLDKDPLRIFFTTKVYGYENIWVFIVYPRQAGEICRTVNVIDAVSVYLELEEISHEPDCQEVRGA